MSVANLPTPVQKSSVAWADKSEQEIADLAGPVKVGNSLPILRVNYNDEDDDKNKIPRGYWMLYAEGVPVYAPTVVFRPLYQAYQYSHFDPDEGKQISQSILFRSFGDEVIDTSGGHKCGKVTGKAKDKLTDAEKTLQRNIKLSYVLYGTVSIEGVNQKGEAHTVVDVPCVFYARGSNFMPMSNFMKELDKANKLMPNSVIRLDLKREKNGGVVYWEVVPSLINTVSLSAENKVLIGKFYDTVQAENATILEKWQAARRKGGDATHATLVAAINGPKKGASGLDDALDDLISGQPSDITLA